MEASEKKVLIIDDLEGMRAQLRMTMTTAGYGRIQSARDIKDALTRMKETQFDIILCDYIMGDSTDGQQFLEYLRAENVLSRNTIFIMVTAEQAYSRVVSASECAPDGYLLKPFTGSQFDTRLAILIEKQAFMNEVNTAVDQMNWQDVIARCNKKIAADDPLKPKYLIDLFKMKALASHQLGDHAEALAAYREIMSIRPLGWAKLGVARMMHLLGEANNARAMLNEILTESPQYLAAYDFMAQTMVEAGDKKGALEMLEKTRRMTLGTLSRLRTMGNLALLTGQPKIAEEIMQQTIKKNKYSPVREMNDYVLLSKALVAQGRAKQAMAVLEEAAETFPRNHEKMLLKSAMSAVYFAEGNYRKAGELLDEAMEEVNTGSLPAHTTMALSEACLLLGRQEQAHEYLSHVVRHHAEHEPAHEKIRDVCAMAGKSKEQTDEIVVAVSEKVAQPQRAASMAALEGRFSESVMMLLQEIEKAPNNIRLKGNAAILIAIDMVCNGLSDNKMEQCLKLGRAITQKAPKHPKLLYLKALLAEIGNTP